MRSSKGIDRRTEIELKEDKVVRINLLKNYHQMFTFISYWKIQVLLSKVRTTRRKRLNLDEQFNFKYLMQYTKRL